MIETLVKISVLGPLDSEVPSVDVVLQRGRNEIGERLFDHVSDLLVDPGLTDAAFHV